MSRLQQRRYGRLDLCAAIVKLRGISGTGSQLPLVTPAMSMGLEGAGIAYQEYCDHSFADTEYARVGRFAGTIGGIHAYHG